jgi:Zn-dependent protease with chaperone function
MLVGSLLVVATVADFPTTPIVIAGVLVIIIEYVTGPWIVSLLFGIRWVNLVEELPQLASAARRLCQEHRIPYPRFGIIEDGNPNAFTYGHHPWNARLVVTRGLVDMLDQKEQEAVLAHELGHIKHWDFVVMTVAALIPLLLYMLGRSLIDSEPDSESDEDRAEALGFKMAGLAILILYYVSEYVFLFLSRVRELYADDFSAEATRDPDALASSLVKIAYGLASVTKEPTPEARRAAASARAFGIFDPNSAATLARSVSGESDAAELATDQDARTFTDHDMLRAMRWDLWNPWAKLYQLASTHPLPAVRIEALGRKAVAFGREPSYRLPEIPPESYWDEFLGDIFTSRLILLGILVGGALVFVFAPRFFPEQELTGAPAPNAGVTVIGFFMAVVGAAITWKVRREYPKPVTDWQVRGLVQEVKVSRYRAIPARLTGRVIGRGVPGLFYSSDLVLDDGSGFITMQYRQPLPGWRFLFGVFGADKLIGRDGVAEGWYRRAPAPYLEVLRFTYPAGTVQTYWYKVKRAVGFVLLAWGLATFVGGLLAGTYG